MKISIEIPQDEGLNCFQLIKANGMVLECNFFYLISDGDKIVGQILSTGRTHRVQKTLEFLSSSVKLLNFPHSPPCLKYRVAILGYFPHLG